jgi:hypothetical protein
MNFNKKLELTCKYARIITTHVGSVVPDEHSILVANNVLEHQSNILSYSNIVKMLADKYNVEYTSDDLSTIVDTSMKLAMTTRDEAIVFEILSEAKDIVDQYEYMRHASNIPSNPLCVIS